MLKFSSVTELVFEINNLLENGLGAFIFEGEISGLQRASAGHLYFSLKDDTSQVSCAMWRSYVSTLKTMPKEGDKVICTGVANVYSKSGRFQIVVSKMEIQGEGDLKKQYEELKKKLEAEGLFDIDRKRKLPFLPKAIGVVTSSTGAVIHDIMFKVNERMPQVQVYLIDVRVQGKGAEKEIADAIYKFNKLNNVDVLIVGRGGGSLEDLWCFNEEVVARAIFASKIPVISAVGHESDVSLSDLVADVRAPTPTGAAQIAVPERHELLKIVRQFKERLSDFQRFLLPYNQHIEYMDERLRKVFKNEILKFHLMYEKINSRCNLSLNPKNQLEIKKKKLEVLKIRLENKSPKEDLVKFQEKLNSLKENLYSLTKNKINEKKMMLEKKQAMLSLLNYKKTLKRGFSIVRSEGKIISQKKEIKANQNISIEFATGNIEAKVLERK